MAFRNSFTIFGEVVKAPVLRRTPGGVPTLTFIVVVDDNRAKGGNKSTRDFIPVTTYGDQAQKDAETLKAGMCVGVKGTIRSWYDKKKGKGGFNFEADSENGVLYLGAA